MSSYMSVAKKLTTLLDDLLENEYSGDSNRIMYCGKTYNKNDFKNFKTLIKHSQYKRKKQINFSADYIKAHREYNNLLRMRNYYMNKESKKEKDYIKIEEIEQELKKIEVKREQEKKLYQDEKCQKVAKDYKKLISGEREFKI